uniref:FHA domain-containing protein n=1 Tax=Aegilops tauschii subsp. strangulata TaxID=200361 RepID=A0A453C351_AEGTS
MSSGDDSALQPIRLIRDEQRTLSIGSKPDPSNSDSSLSFPLPQVSEIHATITCKNKGFYLTDLGSEHGTWFNDNEGRRYRLPPNFPVRFHPSDAIEFGSDKKGHVPGESAQHASIRLRERWRSSAGSMSGDFSDTLSPATVQHSSVNSRHCIIAKERKRIVIFALIQISQNRILNSF